MKKINEDLYTLLPLGACLAIYILTKIFGDDGYLKKKKMIKGYEEFLKKMNTNSDLRKGILKRLNDNPEIKRLLIYYKKLKEENEKRKNNKADIFWPLEYRRECENTIWLLSQKIDKIFIDKEEKMDLSKEFHTFTKRIVSDLLNK